MGPTIGSAVGPHGVPTDEATILRSISGRILGHSRNSFDVLCVTGGSCTGGEAGGVGKVEALLGLGQDQVELLAPSSSSLLLSSLESSDTSIYGLVFKLYRWLYPSILGFLPLSKATCFGPKQPPNRKLTSQLCGAKFVNLCMNRTRARNDGETKATEAELEESGSGVVWAAAVERIWHKKDSQDWPWFSSRRPSNLLSCSLFARCLRQDDAAISSSISSL